MGNQIEIVIGQRGWVWVGRVARSEQSVELTDAKCIRRWGTSKGLGELASGPLSNTVLDPAGTLKLHPLGVVATYGVDQAAWEKVLGS